MQDYSISISREIQDQLPLIADTDHPLSLGYRIYLLTDSAFALDSSRATSNLMSATLGDLRCEGLHATWGGTRRMVVIVIHGAALRPLRIVELLVHEISHCVDAMLDRCEVKEVDTEIRAYLNDWLVGKALHHFNLFLPAPAGEDTLNGAAKDELGISSGYRSEESNHRQSSTSSSDIRWAGPVPSGMGMSKSNISSGLFDLDQGLGCVD